MAKDKRISVKTRTKKSKPGSSGTDANKSPKISLIIKEGGLLILGAIAFYLFICLISFSPEDPGPFHVGGQIPVQNWGGGFGAWIADMMFNVFGKMAYLFIVLIAATPVLIMVVMT